MRRLPGKLCCPAPLLTASLLLLSLFCRPPYSLAQSQELPQYPGRLPLGQEPDPNRDPALRHAQEEAARRRNIDRHKRLTADADKILQLAQELSAEAAKENKSLLPVAISKKAEQIEKLAKSVKDRMRSE